MRPERAWSDLVAIFALSYAVQDLYIEDWLIAVICEAHKLACSWRENGGHGVVNIGPISRMSFSIYSSWAAEVVMNSSRTRKEVYVICIMIGSYMQRLLQVASERRDILVQSV